MKKLVLTSLLAIALLMSAAVLATAAPQTYADGVPGTVTVSANVNPKLVLTIATPNTDGLTVDFGTVDPGSSYGPQTVNLNVKSNLKYDLTHVLTDATPIGLSNTFTDVSTATKPATVAGDDYTDVYSLNVPTNADPGAHTATVVYTATQQ